MVYTNSFIVLFTSRAVHGSLNHRPRLSVHRSQSAYIDGKFKWTILFEMPWPCCVRPWRRAVTFSYQMMVCVCSVIITINVSRGHGERLFCKVIAPLRTKNLSHLFILYSSKNKLMQKKIRKREHECVLMHRCMNSCGSFVCILLNVLSVSTEFLAMVNIKL